MLQRWRRGMLCLISRSIPMAFQSETALAYEIGASLVQLAQ
jgi:hypothetical protein